MSVRPLFPQIRRLLACGILCAIGALAQQPNQPLAITVPSQPDGEIATLHVYTSIEQYAVLALSPAMTQMKPIPESKFRVTIDSGKPFKPLHVRREGDDPLSLAILIDATKPGNELLPKIEEALARLAPQYLAPRDRISIYLVDCSLSHTTHDVAAEPTTLANALVAVTRPWRERLAHKPVPRCRTVLPLWDSMMRATLDLYKQQGRRVLLVISDGNDQGSHTSWQDLKRAVQVSSVAVFGLRPELDPGGWSMNDHPMERGRDLGLGFRENPFEIICEAGGGMLFYASRRTLDQQLHYFIDSVRQRYIVEIPRDRGSSGGLHGIQVTIDNPYAYVRTSGNTIPVLDRKLLDAPLTLPSETRPGPEQGPRRPLETAKPKPDSD